jgi:hypothetical protein
MSAQSHVNLYRQSQIALARSCRSKEDFAQYVVYSAQELWGTASKTAAVVERTY